VFVNLDIISFEIYLDTYIMLSWKELSEEEKLKIEEIYGHNDAMRSLVRYENGFLIPRIFAEELFERLQNFEVREDDIWVVTYPKCGTTWTQELTWMLVNDVDKEAGKESLTVRSVYLEGQCVLNYDYFKAAGFLPTNEKECEVLKDQIAFCDRMDRNKRRVFKSHLPFEFLPPAALEKSKVIYVARNPKDCVVSFYKFMSLPEHGYLGNFSEFCKFFEEGLQLYGSYWHHIKSYWNQRSNKNLKFLWFEDMKKDQRSVINELCDFLNQPLSEEKIDALIDHVKFENMSKNPAAKITGLNDAKYFRKGKVGDWKNHFDEEKNKYWKVWIMENVKGTGLEEVDHIKNLFSNS